jgi:hypothetical protein
VAALTAQHDSASAAVPSGQAERAERQPLA